MFRRVFPIVIVMSCFASMSFAFDLSFRKEAKTPLDIVIEAKDEVEQVSFEDNSIFTTKDSIAFEDFAAIYQSGEMRFLVYSDGDKGDGRVVLDTWKFESTPQRMYVKYKGKWILATQTYIDNFIQREMLPRLKTDLLVDSGIKGTPVAIVLYGDQCGWSKKMESLLQREQIPHWIIPVPSNASTPNQNALADAKISLACGSSKTWREWSQGKKVSFSTCQEKQQYAEFDRQFNKVLSMSPSVAGRGYPWVFDQKGNVTTGYPNEADFLKRLRN